MAAGVALHPWEVSDIVVLVEAAEAQTTPKVRGTQQEARSGRSDFKLPHYQGPTFERCATKAGGAS
jgi:hypothetical protein